MDDLLDGYLTYARAIGLSDRTRFDREKLLTVALRTWGDPRLTTREQLVAWLACPKWSPWTRATYRGHARAFFAWLAEFDHRSDDPAAKLKRGQPPRGMPDPVTDDELRLALARSGEPWLTAILLAAYAGLRVAEIWRLRREDVTEATITVRKGKGGKDAKVPCHPRLWAHLRDLPDGLVVVDLPGVGCRLSSRVSARARQHFDAIGLPGVHMHRFRHWYGTTIQQQQGDLRVTQELMRHESIASTAIYTQVASAAKVAAIQGLRWAA